MSNPVFDIDIKNTHIYLRDGSGDQMEITSLVAGPVAAGATTITFDAATVATEGLEIGMWVAPDDSLRPRYFITAIDGEEITIHKPLEEAIADEAQLYRSDWFELDLEIGEGNLTFSTKQPREYKLSRGRLNRVKNADEEPMDLSLDAIWQSLTSNGVNDPLPYEAVLREGEAAAWVSTGGECQPYALDVVLVHEPDCATLTLPNEMVIFPEFRTNNVDGDLSGSTLAMPGQCMAIRPISIRY